MRVTRALSAALLALGLAAGPALADSSAPGPTPSPSGSASSDGSAPAQAGTSFRTAAEIKQGQAATASGSTGDYLYWSFPADIGERPTVKASVKLPQTHGSQTWQLDVYDGLRRRQACQYGANTRTAAPDASQVELACVLRTVRGWSEPWADDPLPGTYYIRLTVVDLGASDLGLPVSAEVRADSKDIGGAAAVDGSLAKPLVPGIAVKAGGNDEGEGGAKKAVLSSFGSDDGWSSGWWSDRWVWTAIGGVLAALAGIGGYALTRGSGRPSRVPPGV
ncbi:hypothetical protein A6P39_010780 [Streptomyces sp. FXJ1.172]|uniref:hypothetical protein n=1 Tax=Streptomyces sp. FXJ1.172 TaxID=710705 RepID=UPI0007CF95B0|nr:hypothetical protein [Streptomyces sp. FXJ1.172]WEO94454.1 hypothetical protein A6P39_010780 [Streptomyces sp. FXJ1.172]